MALTIEEIRAWLLTAKADGATHLIVATDTSDYEDYPVPVMPNAGDATRSDTVRREVSRLNAEPMTHVMEVYDLSLDLEAQLNSGPDVYVFNF